MKRLKKGNILLGYMDDDLARTMDLYFHRKNFNVFISSEISEIKKILKYNGVSLVLFSAQKETDEALNTAKIIQDYDDQIGIFFICSNREERNTVVQYSPLFFTIQKPFSMRNLQQRMTSVASSKQEQKHILQSFKIGNYTFSFTKQMLTDNQTSKEQHLTKKEALLLMNLCNNPEKYISRHRLMLNVWQKDDNKLTRSMDVYITRLRKYLSGDKRISIDNKHGIGYKLTIVDL